MGKDVVKFFFSTGNIEWVGTIACLYKHYLELLNLVLINRFLEDLNDVDNVNMYSKCAKEKIASVAW